MSIAAVILVAVGLWAVCDISVSQSYIEQDTRPLVSTKQTCELLPTIIQFITDDGCNGSYTALSCSGICPSSEIPQFASERIHRASLRNLLHTQCDCCQSNTARIGSRRFATLVDCGDISYRRYITRPLIIGCACRPCL